MRAPENCYSTRREHLDECFVRRMARKGYILTAVMQMPRQHSKKRSTTVTEIADG